MPEANVKRNLFTKRMWSNGRFNTWRICLSYCLYIDSYEIYSCPALGMACAIKIKSGFYLIRVW